MSLKANLNMKLRWSMIDFAQQYVGPP